MAQSKLSIHINNIVNRDELMCFLLEARPWGVKTMKFDKGFWTEVKAHHPGLKIAARVYQEDSEMHRRVMADPVKAASWYVNDHILHNICPISDLVWGVETINEMARHDKNVWRQQGIYDEEVARLLEPYNIRAIVGNFGVGHPSGTMEEMRELITQPEVIAAYSHPNTIAIGCHGYCAPCMAAEDIYKPWDKDHFCLRHRRWWPMLPPEAQKPIFIGETGIDGGIGPQDWPGVVQGGWKTNLGPDKIDEYLGDQNLAWFDGEIQTEPQVVGAAIFCYTYHNDKHWASYVVDGDDLVKLGQYIQSQTSLEDYVGDTMQTCIIPANATAWFQQYAWDQDPSLGSARSIEVGYDGDLWYKGHPYLAQVFMNDDDLTTQHIVLAQLDDPRPWQEKTTHFDRAN